ncbi:hypothetical protein SAMN05428959_1011356 [Duganella sp. CF517]|uniref:hypothetical protein n=1 Tax=Duganella sp. CF517 TaxID=1881038 RepID=UPI0008B139A4|nr:hypothetical protein [Duganella sp. CF517]SEN36076.1 hypothetical protein SAMN05428959_1011356 [Duganella sp. CF517]
MSALIMLAGAAALTATLMVRVARRRQAQARPPAGVPVTLASWSDGREYQVADHLRRMRR